MDGLADQLFAWEALKKNGSNFKAIPGLESYYIDSLSDWKRMYMEARENGSVTRKKAKKAKGEVEVLQEELAAIGDDSKATEAEIAERYGDDKKAIELLKKAANGGNNRDSRFGREANWGNVHTDGGFYTRA